MKGVRSVLWATAAVAVLSGLAAVVVLDLQGERMLPPASSGADSAAEAPRTEAAVRPATPLPVTPTARPVPRPDARSLAPERAVETVEEGGQAQAKAAPPAEPGPGRPKAPPTKKNSPSTAQAGQRVRPAKDPIQDQMARAALAYVGADPEAEAYWYEAINDASLSAQERQDLIEDLNEDGLSDPKNPTLDDLPMILGRIEILETIVWDAMDEVNFDAILEAYKDLVNLANLVLGDGEPVR
jgi:hypothetical protein